MENEAPTRTQPALYTRSAPEIQEVIGAERAGVPFVVWRDGQGLQHIVPLPAGRPLTVGRRASNDIALVDDPEVSRVHAELESIAGDWAVGDDGLSSNGTFIGEERILGRRRLNDGDVIRFGRTLVEYRRPVVGSTVMTASTHNGLELGRLSDRQRAILVALARPYMGGNPYAVPATNAEVAREVRLGLDAVKGHLKVLYARFEIAHLSRHEKRAKLVQLAFQLGIVTERDL
jgi:FHA domain